VQDQQRHCDIEGLLRGWFTSPLGQRLGEFERQAVEQLLPRIFGFHILQVGTPQSGPPLIAGSLINHRLALGADLSQLDGSAVNAAATALPIASDCVDALLLNHVLEFETDPHQALREAERVLIPEGVLIVIGFNPTSLWGLRGWLRHRQDDVPWGGRFVGLTRLRDWLALLGFEQELSRTLFFRPPAKGSRLLGRMARLESWGSRWWPRLGGVYLVVARKRVVTITPIKPRWRPRRGLITNGYAEPTIRRTNARE